MCRVLFHSKYFCGKKLPLLVLLSSLELVLGIPILVLGLLSHGLVDKYDQILDDFDANIFPTFNIFAGILIVVFSIGKILNETLGDGRIYRALSTILPILLVVFVIWVCGWCYPKSSYIEYLIHEGLKLSISTYGMNDQTAPVVRAWNNVQQELHCCGVNNYRDWEDVRFDFGISGVPVSCCLPNLSPEVCLDEVDFDAPLNDTVTTIYNQGCVQPLYQLIQLKLSALRALLIVAIVILSITCTVQFLASFVSKKDGDVSVEGCVQILYPTPKRKSRSETEEVPLNDR